jgi:hypothetical protein
MDRDSNSQTENRRTLNRKAPRGTVRVECRRARPGLSANIATGLLDLSEGGVRLLAKEPLKLREEVDILFEAFGVPIPVKRSAQVAWLLQLDNGQFAAGLEFHQRLSPEDLVRLSRS